MADMIIKRTPGRPGDNGKDGVSVKLKREGDNIIALYSDGKKDDLGSFKGERGPAVKVDIKAIVEEVITRKSEFKGADGVSPDKNEIVTEVLKRIVLPEPIKGEKGEDAVVDYDLLLSKIVIPEPIKGEKGEDAVVDYNLILSKIPKPQDGKDAVVDYDLILSRIPTPRDGKDAPFSTWVTKHEGTGVTNVETDSCVLFETELSPASVNGISVTVVGKGIKSKYYGKKEGFYTSEGRVESDVVVFNPRRTNPALSFEIQGSRGKVQVVAIGLKDEEIFWKADIEIATL